MCLTFLATMYLRGRSGVSTCSAVSALTRFLTCFRSAVPVLSRRLGYADLLLMLEFVACGACAARSIEAVLCAPCLLSMSECELTAITRNGTRLRVIDLLYAAFAMLPAMPEFCSRIRGPIIEDEVAWAKGRCLMLRALRVTICFIVHGKGIVLSHRSKHR